MTVSKGASLFVKFKLIPIIQVFGTVVDWRTTVTHHLSSRASDALQSTSKSLALHVRTAAAITSWPAFAQAWLDSYRAFCQSHDPDSSFVSVDQHNHNSLRQLIQENGIEGLWDDDEVLEISRIWHFLDAWPDSSEGLEKLTDMGFVLCTLSNGNTDLLKDLAAHTNLRFEHLFSAEDFKAYKPSYKTYLGAAEKLRLRPEECAMVAAHLGDLAKARECGLQTIYLEREGEENWSSNQVSAARSEGWVNMWVGLQERSVGGGIMELARLFGRESL